jgi:hypothetical protein
MTPHAEILSVLAAEFPKWVPKDDVGWPLKNRATGIFFERPDDPSEFWYPLKQYAHLAIREAAWGAVRWWCDTQENDGENGLSLLWRRDRKTGMEHLYGVDYLGHQLLGSGPTDADALLAALKYIAGEMGKEKK